MFTKILPEPNSLVESILFCESLNISELKNPNIVPLFGPNGIGKSTIIKAILKASNGKDNGIKIERTRTDMNVLSYRNSEDNAATTQGRSMNDIFDPRFMIDRFNAQSVSEGQSIIYSVIGLLDLIGTGDLATYNDDGELLVVIDEIDSGLSIDNLDIVMKKLQHTAKNRKDVQVIFSFNNPYVVSYFPEVLSLYTGYPITLKTPEDMLAEIKSHEKEFRKKRYDKDGRPIVYD